MIYTAPCKINLGLNILRRRPDNYHDIETAMFVVPTLCDVIELLGRPSGTVEFSSGGIAVDCPPEDNLALKAYHAVRAAHDIGGALIHLHKNVPYGAGLGGGSSDVMTVIRALSDHYALGLSPDAMASIGATIGSDTPFFAHTSPMICTGRGEIMSPAPWLADTLRGLCLVIVKPPCGVSTAQAYAGIVPRQPARPLAEVLHAPVDTWRESLVNDFEEPVFARLPILADIKSTLYDHGAIYASMSGSGSAIFAISHTPMPDNIFPDEYFTHHTVL